MQQRAVRSYDKTESAAPAAPAARRGQRTLSSGTVLESRYEIQRVCGRGGMSTVYVARDLRFAQVERLCAIKEMFDLDPDANLRALRLVNFEREAALLATISHPAVPRIYDYFQHGGLVYLVLEFIEGQDLERLLDQRQAPFPESQLRQWARELCSVLSTLHGNLPDPIIFRDLKPSNIMLRVTGQIALVDFGIARTIQGRQRGTMIGTEGYAPPEQYRGIADARGDIYALGATLHHLATSSDPRQETPFTFQERPARVLNPALSAEFSALVMKMLAYNPSDRYQNIAAVIADLDALEQRAAIPAENVVVDTAAVTVADLQPPTPHVTLLPLAPAPPIPLVERRAAAKKRGVRRKRPETATNAERLVWATQTGDEVRGSALFDGRSFVIGSYDGHVYALSPVDGSVRWKFRSSRGVVSRPALVEDLLVFGSEDHSIYAVEALNGSQRWSYRTGMPVRSSPTVSRARVLIGSDDGVIYCLNGDDGHVLWKQRAWGPVRSSPVAAKGAVFSGCDDGYLYSVDDDTGRLRWRVACGGPVQSAPHAAGDTVYATSRAGLVSAFDLRTGDRRWQHSAGAAILASPRVSGDIVVVGTVDGELTGLHVEDGTPRWSARLANQITSTPTLAGKLGYVGTIDGDCLCINIETGEMIWRHQVGAGVVSSPAYGNGVLVVGSLDGRVCGLALTEFEIEVLQKG